MATKQHGNTGYTPATSVPDKSRLKVADWEEDDEDEGDEGDTEGELSDKTETREGEDEEEEEEEEEDETKAKGQKRKKRSKEKYMKVVFRTYTNPYPLFHTLYLFLNTYPFFHFDPLWDTLDQISRYVNQHFEGELLAKMEKILGRLETLDPHMFALARSCVFVSVRCTVDQLTLNTGTKSFTGCSVSSPCSRRRNLTVWIIQAIHLQQLTFHQKPKPTESATSVKEKMKLSSVTSATHHLMIQTNLLPNQLLLGTGHSLH